MDVIATNDGRLPHEKIERIRQLRPDMILLSGGVDGGTTSHVVEMAELLAAADPKARLGAGYELPVIYAGNKDARGIVEERLGEQDRAQRSSTTCARCSSGRTSAPRGTRSTTCSWST